MRVNSLPDVSERRLESFSFEWSPVAEVLALKLDAPRYRVISISAKWLRS
jgi:hypothetical protein